MVNTACLHGCLEISLRCGLDYEYDKGFGHPQFHPMPLLEAVTALTNKHFPVSQSKPPSPVLLTHPQQGLCVLKLTSLGYSGSCFLAAVRKHFSQPRLLVKQNNAHHSNTRQYQNFNSINIPYFIIQNKPILLSTCIRNQCIGETWKSSIFYVSSLGRLTDTVGLVPDHYNKVIITIKQVT